MIKCCRNWSSFPSAILVQQHTNNDDDDDDEDDDDNDYNKFIDREIQKSFLALMILILNSCAF